jgi:phage shock protein A
MANKSVLSQIQAVSEDAIGRITKSPTTRSALEKGMQLKDRAGKTLTGLDAIDARLAAIEKRLTALEKKGKPASTRKRSSSAKTSSKSTSSTTAPEPSSSTEPQSPTS